MLLAWQSGDLFLDFWPHIAAALAAILAVSASAHAVLHKRDTRAAIAWVGVIWLAPVLGSLLYVWLGINRIRRKARQLRADPTHAPRRSEEDACSEEVIDTTLADKGQHLRELVRMGGALTKRPLLAGNCIEPLVGSNEAYPAMLAAIDSARTSIALGTYIFNNDETGRKFVTALGAAVARGVEVRVLIDDVGSRYKLPPIVWRLRHNKVTTARFLPALVPMFMP
ncbi:MAG TPA: PLDc N-terminal domain-containing protein, partial [Pirellulales bacterium]|nr:PLDc N-terminal domain-containing protein [Pirellulales bacterium]